MKFGSKPTSDMTPSAWDGSPLSPNTLIGLGIQVPEGTTFASLEREGDSLKLGDVDLAFINYRFHEGKLVGVTFGTHNDKGLGSCDRLASQLGLVWGAPQDVWRGQFNDSFRRWNGLDVVALMSTSSWSSCDASIYDRRFLNDLATKAGTEAASERDRQKAGTAQDM